jgi:hypothetical protein
MRQILSDFIKMIFGIKDEEPIDTAGIIMVMIFVVFLVFIFGAMAMG